MRGIKSGTSIPLPWLQCRQRCSLASQSDQRRPNQSGQPLVCRLTRRRRSTVLAARSLKRRQAKLEVADARPPEFSDESLALRFTARHAGTARHVAAWGRWLLWTGTVWQFDETMRTFGLSRIICRVASAEVEPKKTRLAA